MFRQPRKKVFREKMYGVNPKLIVLTKSLFPTNTNCSSSEEKFWLNSVCARMLLFILCLRFICQPDATFHKTELTRSLGTSRYTKFSARAIKCLF